MKNPFNIGDLKVYSHRVSKEDLASFESEAVHDVYSTFALGRDAEWSGRLFVLEMKEMHEEGIGTHLSIDHISPALLGQEVLFTSELLSVNKNEVVTSFVAQVGKRQVAKGKQIQKIVAKEKLNRLFEELE